MTVWSQQERIDYVCRSVALRKKPIRSLAKELGLEVEQIRGLLAEHRDTVRHFWLAEDMRRRKKRDALYDKSIAVMREILSTDHYITVKDKDGKVKSRKVDSVILKAKKEIACDVVSDVLHLKKKRTRSDREEKAKANKEKTLDQMHEMELAAELEVM